MLNIFIYTSLIISIILNFWWCFNAPNLFYDFELKKINAIFNYIRKPSKSPIPLTKDNFWCVLTIFIFHLVLLLSTTSIMNELVLIMAPTKIQVITSMILAFISILFFIGYRGATNDILLELKRLIDESNTEEIIYWINTYKKMPFVLKMALKRNKNTHFINVYQSMTLHSELQNKLPEKIEKVKINKI
jgi:hypothetical protein